jgi:RNA polymerase sigma-70 factor (ECF subfamily)
MAQILRRGDPEKMRRNPPDGPRQEDLGRIAELMKDLRGGSKEAAGQLVAAFYPELRRMAARRMRSERTPHTWQPTVLVNELYLELLKIRSLHTIDNKSDREAFLGLGAHIMRRLLIHHARPLQRQVDKVELSDDLRFEANGLAELASIESLLTRLSKIDPQLRTIVEMRVFEGLSVREIATQLNCAPRTVDRRWSFARKWLEHQLAPSQR